MINKLKVWTVAAAVALGFGLGGAASAQPYLAPGVQNTISDDYGERVYDADGSGTVTVGDVFIGVVGITGSAPATFLNSTGQLPQLTGVFAATVSAVVGASASFATSTAAELAAAGAAVGLTPAQVVTLGGLPSAGTGGVLWVFEGADADFFTLGSHTSISDGFDRSTDGPVVLVAGFDGSAGESMGALANTFIIPSAAGVPAALAGTFFWNLSVLAEFWPDIIGFGILPTGTELFLSGNINSCNAVHATTCPTYQYASDATATFIPIPEPATLALFGAGLLGLAIGLRRRRKAA